MRACVYKCLCLCVYIYESLSIKIYNFFPDFIFYLILYF